MTEIDKLRAALAKIAAVASAAANGSEPRDDEDGAPKDAVVLASNGGRCVPRSSCPRPCW